MPTFFGPLTGKQYDSVEALRHYEGREAMRRNSTPSAEAKALGGLSLEQLRKGYDELARSESQKLAQEQGLIDCDAFLQAYPEYLDCNENSGAMKFFLEGMGVDTRPGAAFTFEQLEESFLHLKAGGFLKLNASAVKKQQQQAVTNRVEEVKRKQHFDEDEAYAMPMNELVRRAGGIF